MLHNLKMAIVFHSTNIFEHRLCVRVKEPRVKPRQGPHSGSSAIQILEEELASYDRQGKSNTLFFYIPWAKNDSYKVKSLKKIFVLIITLHLEVLSVFKKWPLQLQYLIKFLSPWFWYIFAVFAKDISSQANFNSYSSMEPDSTFS